MTGGRGRGPAEQLEDAVIAEMARLNGPMKTRPGEYVPYPECLRPIARAVIEVVRSDTSTPNGGPA